MLFVLRCDQSQWSFQEPNKFFNFSICLWMIRWTFFFLILKHSHNEWTDWKTNVEPESEWRRSGNPCCAIIILKKALITRGVTNSTDVDFFDFHWVENESPLSKIRSVKCVDSRLITVNLVSNNSWFLTIFYIFFTALNNYYTFWPFILYYLRISAPFCLY
jgi:hypothetical protein